MIDELKLTDWYPAEVLPARPGWYLRWWVFPEMRGTPDLFDGTHWFSGFGDGSYSKNRSLVPRRWRGLAEPPLTDWFDPDTPPVREGVYELEAEDGGVRALAHWTPGHGWGLTYHAVRIGDNLAVRAAYRDRFHRGTTAPRRRWRGLAVQP